ncbi:MULTISPECIES: hypothetical protein [Glaesserella]|nr:MULTISPECIES: hypothetical protein [Glaesserella]
MSRITLILPNKSHQVEVMVYRQACLTKGDKIPGSAMLDKFDDF